MANRKIINQVLRFQGLLSLSLPLRIHRPNIFARQHFIGSSNPHRIVDQCFRGVQVQTKRVTKLCNNKNIVTVNGMFPGPVIRAQEGDRILVKVTNETPFNTTIHW